MTNEDGIERNKNFGSIVTEGMRGDGGPADLMTR